MLPRVILHNEATLDGRMDWFAPHIGLYYELASRWGEDATLAGCDTMLAMEDELPEEGDSPSEPPTVDPADPRALLVIPDSRGRLRKWSQLREMPYWRDVVALCSHKTPTAFLDYLKEQHITTIISGDDHVDLRAALEELNRRYGVKTVRADSGGTLNGVLLRAGLVDEVSLLIAPCLVGGASPRSMFTAPDLTSPDGIIPLKLMHVEQMEEEVVWLKYEVIK